MKAFFLIVSLLNVGFFFWEFHRGALDVPQPQTVLPTFLLVDEQEHARRGATISAYLDKQVQSLQQLETARIADRLTANTRTKPWTAAFKPEPINKGKLKSPVSLCYETGPFTDQSEATAWLSEQALRGQIFYKETLMPSAYQVYYPAPKNSEQLRLSKMMLNAKGITDIWVVPSGDLKGVLSLGLFNNMARAVVFKNQLLQRGVQAEIKERYKPQSRLFVKIKTDKKLTKNVTPIDCEERR